LPEQNLVTDDFVSLLRTVRDKDGFVHGFEEYANRMGLEVTCSLMLGRRMGFLREQVDPLTARLAAAVKVCTKPTYIGTRRVYSVRGLERSELGGSHGCPGRLWDRFL